jgi:hypothetical protein
LQGAYLSALRVRERKVLDWKRYGLTRRNKTMTDPIVEQALLDLVDVMRDLTKFVEEINQRVKIAEDRLDHMDFIKYGNRK